MKESYYLFSSGTLSRKDNTIRLKAVTGEFKDLKIEVTRDIYLFGEVTLNTKCLNYIGELGIIVHVFNYYGFYSGSFYPRESKVSGKLLIKQVEVLSNSLKQLEIAKEFIRGASYNILKNLKYYRNREKNVSDEIGEIEFLQEHIEKSKNINELMGVEGNIRKTYYRSWKKIFNREVEFEKKD